MVVLNFDAVLELCNCFGRRNAFHLYEIRPLMSHAGFQKLFDKWTIVREQEQSFRIGVEAAGGIQSLRQMKLRKRSLAAMVRRELAQDAAGLVEDNIARNCRNRRELVNVTSQAMQFDSLIFDLDGTLWDTCDTCAIAWNAVLDHHAISFRKITGDDVRSVCGRPHEECIRTVFQGLSSEAHDLLIADTMAEDNRKVQELGGILYHGVCAGIASLAKQHQLFIVSNCQAGYIEHFLQFSGLQSYFKDYECWGNTRLSKAKNTQAIITRNNLVAPIFIGDTVGDQAAAMEAGIPFAFLTYGFGDVNQYDYRFETFPELTQWFLLNMTNSCSRVSS